MDKRDTDMALRHAPVMLREVLESLAPLSGAVIVDATFGGGGYSRAFLDAGATRVIGVDRDPEAAERAAELAAREPRFGFVAGAFGDLEALLGEIGIERVDGIVFDLGVSSFQLDDPRRGFAFRFDGPLDMRMALKGPTAADLLAELDVDALTTLLRDLGDEPQAKRIARAIVASRSRVPLRTTAQLRDLVARVKGPGARSVDPATQTFQALRMAVNDETGELERALEAARRLLGPGGRLVVVSFHSGEDGRVKRYVNAHGGRPEQSSRHRPAASGPAPAFAWATRKPLAPTAAESLANPRARSARLRAAVRLDDRAADAEPDPFSRIAA